MPPLLDSAKQRCLSLLSSGGCSSSEHLRQLHAFLETSGLLSGDKFLAGELVRAFALSPFLAGGPSHACRILLTRLPAASSAAWNHVIRGYARGEGGLGPQPASAVSVFLEMRRRGGPSARPNELTYPFVLNAAASLGDLRFGGQVHADVTKSSADGVVYVGNTLVHLYGSCGDITNAWKVFDEMPVRTVVSWNTMLSVLNNNAHYDESVKLFWRMRSSEFEPDETTYVVLLSAAAEVGNLSLGKWVHCQVIEGGTTANVQLGTSLVDMYAKLGAVDYARQVFEIMPTKNVWTWSAMILGFAQHGFAREALVLFSQMKKAVIKPNYVTFLGVLCSCSHAGLVDEGYSFFQEMVHDHGIEPKMSHYSAMVDVLGRSGRLEEACKFIESMPIEPDAVVWRTLLSACNIHSTGNAGEVGSYARQRLFKLEPSRSGNYVLMANMFAEDGMWDEAAKMRRAMKDKGMKKMAGESCIQVGNNMKSFLSADESHVVVHEDIYCLLDGLNMNMKINSCIASKDLPIEMLLV